jgi:hypothetical protein
MPVPDFAVGEVLTAAAMDSIGLWLVKTQTIGTSVSSVTVTGAFSADYDNYRIIISGGANSADSGATLRLGSAVGSTGYYSAQGSFLYSTDGISYLRNNNATQWVNIGAAFPAGLALDVTLFNPNQARFTGLAINSRVDYRTTGGASVGNGMHAVSTAYTDFTFSAGTGNMTGGIIRVYGFRN